MPPAEVEELLEDLTPVEEADGRVTFQEELFVGEFSPLHYYGPISLQTLNRIVDELEQTYYIEELVLDGVESGIEIHIIGRKK